MLKTVLTSLFITLILATVGCSEKAVSPEEQVRAMLAAGEVAVESRSVTGSGAFIAENYRDESGRQRKDLLRLLAGYFLAHQKIHLLVQVNRIQLIGSNRAEVTLFVAVAGRSEISLEKLSTIRADLVRFDLELGKTDGEWLLRSAQWRRAKQLDFLE
ncbi:MAG: hypothetical protein ABW168_21995 [Sedimenticola sp.]